ADEGGGRPDGGKHAGAAQDPPPVACFDALEARRDSFLDAFSVGGTGRDLQLGHGRLEKLHDLALSIGKLLHGLRRRAYADELTQCRFGPNFRNRPASVMIRIVPNSSL